MSSYSRRQFIQNSLLVAGLPGGMSIPAVSTASSTSRKGTDLVFLGKTGIRASRLALGTGFNGYSRSSAQTRMGKEKFDRLLRFGLEKGITFLDMADLYGSHPFVKGVIQGSRRTQLTLLTKIWPLKEKWNDASGGAKEEVDRFRKELNTDYLDICLIHCMTHGKWTESYAKIREDLSEWKQKKVVRAVGVSCHNLDALRIASQDPWVDVIFARINNMGGSAYSMDGTVEEVSSVLKAARKNSKAVIGMKVFGAGKLIKPREKDASLSYVFKEDLVDAITIGMMGPEEVNDSLQRMEQVSVG